ncbi:sensory box protein [Hydrogenophaga sp. RAC07]|uniref:PAS domain-containing hybrid sensor histidine kinase/response regulator n=1 Tax=Hydrogenophaga sp. RAC07 TaxID=1842537 RepID=UPI00083E62DD|nr:PAS domain S-box protein [Hydrogenophaga sp. RAC07]AOF86039.1 sensory box protein [Hydrogenophaga sp. RAC07]
MQPAQSSSDAEEQLHKNQLLLKMAGRAARLGGWSFDAGSEVLTWSDETCEIHGLPGGYQPTLAEGIACYAPAYRAAIAALVSRCLVDGTPFDLEAEMDTADQRRIWVRAIGEPVRDASGSVTGLQGALQDITTQRAHEIERHALATKLSATLHNMSDAFFTLDREWRITFVNEEMTRAVNRKREDMLHQRMWDVFPGTENGLFHRSFQRAVDTGRVSNEVGFYKPLGKWFELRTHPTEDGVAVYFQDVTQKRQDEEQLRLLQACVERMNDIIVVTEAEPVDGLWPRVLYVNEAFERHTGYQPHEIIGKTPRLLQGPRTQRDVLDRIRTHLERWEPVREEVLNYTKNGDEIWLELDIVPITDAEGRYTHWISIERNITERKRAADALRQKENLLKVGGRVGKIGGWTALPTTNAVEWSDEIYAMLDWPRASPPTLGEFLAVFSSGSRAAFKGALNTCATLGTGFDREFQITTCAGELKWVRAVAEPALTEAGHVSGVHGALQDTTVMKQVEERLREQAALLDKAQDAIWVLNLDGTVAFWNRSAERIYGWTVEEVRHRGARELLFNNPSVFDRCQQTVMEQGEWVGEIEHKTQDGKHLLLVSRWTLVRDEAGQPRSILAINTDITHQKLLEQQFLRAQRMESIGTLAGGIAHDLNNVLAPIMMSIELLKGSLPDPDDQAVLKTIAVSARRGADMIKQVLSFARGVEGKRHEVRITDVLRDLDQILSETIPKNISIVSSVAPDLWQVQADPTQLQQVLMNLCVNARDAMPGGGRITISADNLAVDAHYAAMNIEARVGAYVKIEVEDNGAGIPPDIQDRVFDPFFTTKPVGEGTGLGLATTLAIVKSHGGFVRLYSEVDKGTRFRIYLPADPQAEGAQSSPAPSSVPRGNGELIMVVDDEAAIREVTRQTLEAYGYRVVVAANGAEAVALYAQNVQGIALVMTDMMMPVMDGPATVRALRQINPLVKLIGASGISQNGQVARATGAGLHHFLPKPYTADVMLRLIDTVLKT